MVVEDQVDALAELAMRLTTNLTFCSCIVCTTAFSSLFLKLKLLERPQLAGILLRIRRKAEKDVALCESIKVQARIFY